MALPKPVKKVKLIAGVMYSNCYEEILERLKEKFGEIDFESEEYDFKFTDYYEKEHGTGLKKRIISFKELIDRERLADIKLITNEIEGIGCKRTFNIDPGYLTEHNVILASAKERPHKVYIGKGMFGDVVLEYRKGFQHYSHTFPDYREELVKNFLSEIRKIYLEQLK